MPQYLVHDTQKWGDCLSGALTLTDYMNGMVELAFSAIHFAKFSPWRVIDGIHFFSVTLTGYKLPPAPTASSVRYATLRGPFNRLVDERGTTYQRGIPQPITSEDALLLSTPPFTDHFLLTTEPVELDSDDPRWTAVFPADAPCTWQGHYALLAGPFHRSGRRRSPCLSPRRAAGDLLQNVDVLQSDGYQSLISSYSIGPGTM